MKVLGVAIASGTIYYGALEAEGEPQACTAISTSPERLVPAAGLTGAAQLADTHSRIVQDIRTLAPDAVILVGTRKHSQWVYREAVDRVTLIAAMMLSCNQEKVIYEELSTDRIGKAVGIPPKSLSSFDHEVVRLPRKPMYWTIGRAAAFAAATAYVKETIAD